MVISEFESGRLSKLSDSTSDFIVLFAIPSLVLEKGSAIIQMGELSFLDFFFHKAVFEYRCFIHSMSFCDNVDRTR